LNYFEVARDVLLNSGVAIVNADFDPNVPYSPEILITCPERICSCDETRMELDYTRHDWPYLALFKGRGR